MDRLPSAEEKRVAPQLAQELLEGLLQSLSLAEADAEEARARRILLGLGFSTALQDSKVTQLSGQAYCRSGSEGACMYDGWNVPAIPERLTDDWVCAWGRRVEGEGGAGAGAVHGARHPAAG